MMLSVFSELTLLLLYQLPDIHLFSGFEKYNPC